jgi:hypothetical protein
MNNKTIKKNKIRDKKGDITTNTNEIKIIIGRIL